MKDPYKVLGLKRDATEDDIKQRVRVLQMKHHPDRNPGNKKAETKFKEIDEAASILLDERKRKEYDTTGEVSRFSFDPEILSCVMSKFVQQISNGRFKADTTDFIGFCEKEFDVNKRPILTQRSDVERAIDSMKKVLKQFPDIPKNQQMRQYLISKIGLVQNDLDSINEKIKMIEKTLDFIKRTKYDYTKAVGSIITIRLV